MSKVLWLNLLKEAAQDNGHWRRGASPNTALWQAELATSKLVSPIDGDSWYAESIRQIPLTKAYNEPGIKKWFDDRIETKL